ncbi:hypothetical protein WMF27_46630 [Sorangium sp. So ce281]|uniref:hypothetical protein n=1 Tax=unclassified Sorangium TaxID=2621164 RepID=UPI003F5F6A32
MKHAEPTLTATAPNPIWTWDITELRGPLPGVFYGLYVVLDLLSRTTVGWSRNAPLCAIHSWDSRPACLNPVGIFRPICASVG